MEDFVSDFPFLKLRGHKFLTLEILMHVKFKDVCNFLFSASKGTRTFLEHNFLAVKNGFINDGLITYKIRENFNDYL
jgi:hypothetical protein